MKLVDLLPKFYRKIEEIQEVLRVVKIQLQRLFLFAEKKVNQMSILTATSDLDKWEEEYAIPINRELSDDERREVLISKKRGSGTTTTNLIKTVAESYSNGIVDVIEENSKYIVKIKFVGTRGIPRNMVGLEKSIRSIIPAHLKVEYIFTYMTWDEFESYNKTVDDWDSLHLTMQEMMEYKEV